MNARKMGKSAGTNPKPQGQGSRKPSAGVTRTAGDTPKDYKEVPDAPVEKSARIIKWSV